MNEPVFEMWAILELMGHRRLGGYVRETTIAGAGLLRIDIPMADGKTATQFYPPSALYCLTPTTEEIARVVALANQPAPVSRWELPAPSGIGTAPEHLEDTLEYDDDEDVGIHTDGFEE